VYCTGCYQDHQNSFINKTIKKIRTAEEEEEWTKRIEEAKDDAEKEKIKAEKAE